MRVGGETEWYVVFHTGVETVGMNKIKDGFIYTLLDSSVPDTFINSVCFHYNVAAFRAKCLTNQHCSDEQN